MADLFWVYHLGLKVIINKMAKKTVMEVSAHLEKHEAFCTERWVETIHRIKRLEFFVIATIVTLLMSAGTILTNQLF